MQTDFFLRVEHWFKNVVKSFKRLNIYHPRKPCSLINGGSDGKASAYNEGNLGLIPGSGGSPGEGNANPTPVLLPGKSHELRILVGYSPWGRKESDTTE